MPYFVVRFMKDLLGENGQMREVGQALDARDHGKPSKRLSKGSVTCTGPVTGPCTQTA
jgi:hypothetical protein